MSPLPQAGRMPGVDPAPEAIRWAAAPWAEPSLRRRHAPGYVADACCCLRPESLGHHQVGAVPRGADCAAIIRRSTPKAA